MNLSQIISLIKYNFLILFLIISLVPPRPMQGAAHQKGAKGVPLLKCKMGPITQKMWSCIDQSKPLTACCVEQYSDSENSTFLPNTNQERITQKNDTEVIELPLNAVLNRLKFASQYPPNFIGESIQPLLSIGTHVFKKKLGTQSSTPLTTAITSIYMLAPGHMYALM